MEKIKNKIQEHPAYSDFSGSNEQFLSELTGTIRDIVTDLNSRNSISDDIFNRLYDTIEISNAVFRSFSSHEGLELVLRLKSISELYKRNLKDNSNLIKIAEHVLRKLEKFNTSFYHEATSDEILYPELPPEITPDDRSMKKNLKFKWTTFERNGSLFIKQFSMLEITDFPSNSTFENNENSVFYEYKNKRIPIIDLMKTKNSIFKPPARLLMIDQGKYCYAADLTGKEIHGSYDLISSIVRPINIDNSMFSGRVRIFGRNYLVIRHD